MSAITANPPYYIGLTQWHHPNWYHRDHRKPNSLRVYANHFNTVEGNNSFYGLPTENSVRQWAEQTPDHFRFCFKFPRTISHSDDLRKTYQLIDEFLERMRPLESKLGMLWLQFSAAFTPERLTELNGVLKQLPRDFNYAVEVRNLRFFDKSANETALNRLLLAYEVNRAIFDTRSLFANQLRDPATMDALSKKPRVPTHVIATGKSPLVRYIGPQDIELAKANLSAWVAKCLQWIDEGKTPYIFFHTPSNDAAPALALWFAQVMRQARPDLPEVSLWPLAPDQTSLL